MLKMDETSLLIPLGSLAVLKQSFSFFLGLKQIPDSYSADGCCSCGHVFTEKKLIGGKRFSGKCNMHLSTEEKVISVDMDTDLTRCTYPDGDSCFRIYQISWIKMEKYVSEMVSPSRATPHGNLIF